MEITSFPTPPNYSFKTMDDFLIVKNHFKVTYLQVFFKVANLQSLYSPMANQITLYDQVYRLMMLIFSSLFQFDLIHHMVDIPSLFQRV